ncbi:MAG: hypothetical protein J0G30_13195 [Actinomycetales bacterium]|nr:hypothetical protein [Actinomycetales bacterium]
MSVELDRPPRPRGMPARVRADSLWILAGYAITGGTGFLFWVLAARLIAPERLGYETAVYSVFTAAAAIAASGVGDALLVMLPTAGPDRLRLLRAAVLTTLGVGLVTGTLAGVAAAFALESIDAPIRTGLLILAGTLIWSLFVLKDPTLQGIGRARDTLLLNGPVNVAKLGVLPLVALWLGTQVGMIPVAVLPAALVAVVIAFGVMVLPRVRRGDELLGDAAVSSRPRGFDRRVFTVFVVRDGIASGLYMASFLVVPFATTWLAGPEQGALLALCFQIGMMLDLVALAFGASFSAHAAADDATGAHALGLWLRVLAIVGGGAVLLVAVSPVILGILGGFYLDSGGVAVIAILALGGVLRTAWEIRGASLRARHRTTTLLVGAIVQVVVLVPVGLIAIPAWGAVGAAVTVLAATVALAVMGLVGLLRDERRAKAAA